MRSLRTGKEGQQLRISSAAEGVPASGIREIVNTVFSKPPGEIIRLEVGEPSFAPPAHVLEAAHAAVEAGVGYTPSTGILPLRSAIAERVSAETGVAVGVEQVVVAQGAIQGLSVAFSAILDPGDEVLIPDPGYPNYEMLVRLYHAGPRRYPLAAADGFLPRVETLDQLVGPRTKAIVLNSPGNPTGAVFPPELVRELVEFAAHRGIWVLSDEVYDELIFRGEPARALRYGADNVIAVYSFSKTYAMTGWRIGYVVAPRPLATVMAKLQEPLISCASGVSQQAALAAISGPQTAVAAMREEYRTRRDLVAALLAQLGIDAVTPQGAFYQMIPLAPGADSRAAAFDLLDAGVALAPGTAFGAVAADHVRLSLAASPVALLEGLERFGVWRERTANGRRLAPLPAST